MIWKNKTDLAAFTKRGQDTMVTHLGIEFTELGDDYLTAKMPVDERTRQPIGIMHGGASCVLAETVGSMAANAAVDINTHYAVGLSINTNHIKSIKTGFVYAKAMPVHLGRTTQVWEIDITNEEKQLISRTTLTMAVLERKNT